MPIRITDDANAVAHILDENVYVRGIHRTGNSNWRLAAENGFDPGHLLIHWDNQIVAATDRKLGLGVEPIGEGAIKIIDEPDGPQGHHEHVQHARVQVHHGKQGGEHARARQKLLLRAHLDGPAGHPAGRALAEPRDGRNTNGTCRPTTSITSTGKSWSAAAATKTSGARRTTCTTIFSSRWRCATSTTTTCSRARRCRTSTSGATDGTASRCAPSTPPPSPGARSRRASTAVSRSRRNRTTDRTTDR